MNVLGRFIIALCAIVALLGAVNPGLERHSDEPQTLSLAERLSLRALYGAIRRRFRKQLTASLKTSGLLSALLTRPRRHRIPRVPRRSSSRARHASPSRCRRVRNRIAPFEMRPPRHCDTLEHGGALRFSGAGTLGGKHLGMYLKGMVF